MLDHISIRFYAELNDLLTPQQRHIVIMHKLKQPGSVMDLIESLGVPHSEIDLIHNGEQISIFTHFRTLVIYACRVLILCTVIIMMTWR